MAKRVMVALTSAPFALIGCHSSTGTDLPTAPPTSVTKVASGGFSSPTDAVSSPDGGTFYFAAIDEEHEPAIFETASEPGSIPEVLAVGDPLGLAMGLAISCDGATLFVADIGGDSGAVLSTPTSGGGLTDLRVTSLTRPSGIAMGADCKTLYVTGYTVDGKPGLFAMSIAGGDARTIWAGAPFVQPTGLNVDSLGVAWVMDRFAIGAHGPGVLFAVPADGSAANEVVSNLRMGTPGGVSLTAGGGTAVMPTLDGDGKAQLTSVDIASGEMTQLATPLVGPAGLRTARQAGVFALVDSETSAIYRAE